MKPTSDNMKKPPTVIVENYERVGSLEENHISQAFGRDVSGVEASRIIYTNSESNQNSSYNSSNGIINHPVSLFNLLFYVLCISALGFSLYANLRQIHNEDKLRHFRHLDDRIADLESKLQQFMQMRQSSVVSEGVQTADQGAATGFTATADFSSDVASVVRKLSLQVEGIQRLRRDVSHLQMTRRQASIQSEPDCMCPAGESIFSFISLF